jgi:hypothetical protein
MFIGCWLVYPVHCQHRRSQQSPSLFRRDTPHICTFSDMLETFKDAFAKSNGNEARL